MERLYENIEFYITTSGELRLKVIYIEQETINRIEKDIDVPAAYINKTNAVINLANELLDKAGV